MEKKRKPGRPPAGLKPGEHTADYRRLTVRVPERVFALMDRLQARTGLSQWRIIAEAVAQYDEATRKRSAN